jgi:regulation of enolase protein 1 (concanavalin A-like superfamily)
MGINGSGAFYQQRRTSTGGSTASTASGTGTAPNIWVRVTRSSNKLVCYKSTNGTSWTLVDSRNVNMASSCYLGLAVSAGSATNINTSIFDNITAVP